jgi:aryl-alcohol dehydrogenase-like predicted oxidoreductase
LYVIVKEALANGRLTARGGNPALGRAARDRGTTEDALALSAALAQPWADLVLSGAATVEQLRSNLAAREVAWDDELEAQLAGLVEEPAAYWGARAQLPWN